MTKLEQLKQENPRFIIKDWVSDWGIYDILTKKFIGIPLESFPNAERTLLWFLTYQSGSKRGSQELCGLAFIEWADEYFDCSKLNVEIVKNDIIENIRQNSFFLKDITSHSFKTKLKAYCEIRSIHYFDRIMRNVKGITTEMILIKTHEI